MIAPHIPSPLMTGSSPQRTPEGVRLRPCTGRRPLGVAAAACVAGSFYASPALSEPTQQNAPAPSGEVAADPEGALGLLSDVERIVDAEEYDQWFTDGEAYANVLPALLQSVCRATPAARREALQVARRQARRSGDARALFQQAGEITDAVEQALHDERKYEALRRGVEQTHSECPFWSPPEPEFLGRQTTRRRFALSVETGGLAQLRIAAGEANIGGGGAARLLGSYRFNDSVTLLGGYGFSGGAMVTLDTASSEVIINYFSAVPVVLRYHDVAWHYELETGYVSLIQADNRIPSRGFRVGAGIGYSTLRLRTIIPWVGFIVAGEHYFRGGGRPPMQFVRIGARGGFFWDP
jgi:hypothetical protein